MLEPLGPITALAGAPPLTSEFWAERRDAQLAAVRSQTRLVPGCDWPVAIIQGNTVEAIARQARNLNACMVVLGRGRHGLAARALGGETVQRVVRLAHAPVLAVDAGATSLPRRVVLAVDFSSHSIAAARDALAFVAPDAVVYLVHVRPHARFTGPSTARWERTYDEAVPAFLAVVRDRLDGSDTLQIEATLSTESVARAYWTRALREFSRRSRGQRCGLEVHASGDGAHLLGSGLEMIGADFDEYNDGRDAYVRRRRT